MFKYFLKYISAPLKLAVPFNRNLNSEPMIWALSIYIIANIYDTLEIFKPVDGLSLYNLLNGIVLLFAFIIIFILIAIIVWQINKKNSFFNHNINETISGKTFFFRTIILVILSSYLLEYFDDAINLSLSERGSDSYSDRRANSGMRFFYYLFYLYTIKLDLTIYLKRMNAVFMNSINTLKSVFYILLISVIYVFIYDLEINFIKTKQTIISEVILTTLIISNLLIFIYLTTKNSPITDSKQHKG